MFGIDNTGVINQRQSPAIWQSDIADFPPNYILGRILIDTFQGGIYIDTATTRMQITNGSNNFTNGISNFGGIPASNNIGLGGSLNDNTNINVENGYLNFVGGETSFKIINGKIQDTQSSYLYSPIDGNFYTTIIIPTGYLTLYNSATNTYYKIPALEI